MIILSSHDVDRQLDSIYTDYSIAFVGNTFSKSFLRWNKAFCDDVTKALNNLLSVYVGSVCTLQIRYFHIPNNIIAVIVRCDIDMPLLRSVERQSNAERIQNGLPAVPPTTFSSMPTVNVAQSPRFTWTPPTPKKLVLPKGLVVSKNVYYNGFKVGYYNKRYVILDKMGNPTSTMWLDRKPKFFAKPFGNLGIIAHVSINGYIYAMDVNGTYYNMQKKWDDVYLSEAYRIWLNTIITETINNYLRKNLLLAS